VEHILKRYEISQETGKNPFLVPCSRPVCCNPRKALGRPDRAGKRLGKALDFVGQLDPCHIGGRSILCIDKDNRLVESASD